MVGSQRRRCVGGFMCCCGVLRVFLVCWGGGLFVFWVVFLVGVVFWVLLGVGFECFVVDLWLICGVLYGC